ncbi:hypothetical protein GIX45_11645 [Erwinia sp. CPCC 100877]|nr:hypothetical protein [Erwinia sp. CPCC 100877]
MIKISEKHLFKGIYFIEFQLTEKFSITFSNLGGSIFEIKFADKFNHTEPITLAPADPLSWISQRTFAGSIIGPLAGRYDPKDTTLEKIEELFISTAELMAMTSKFGTMR